MHIFDPKVHFSCSGIVAEGSPPAVGAGLASKLQGKDDIAVSYLGEGAANQGGFHESVNLAAVWKLPVIFVIEDNAYGISVPKAASTAIADNSIRAQAYGIPGVRIAENDTMALFDAAGEAVARARRGDGPTLIEVETYRYFGHFQGDAEGYRPKGEVDTLKKKDPIPRFRAQLIAAGHMTDQEAAEIERKMKLEVDDAYAYARASEYPKPEDALQAVFA
jgi:pyruvate dehydrogenase E1 component alpha subunit